MLLCVRRWVRTSVKASTPPGRYYGVSSPESGPTRVRESGVYRQRRAVSAVTANASGESRSARRRMLRRRFSSPLPSLSALIVAVIVESWVSPGYGAFIAALTLPLRLLSILNGGEILGEWTITVSTHLLAGDEKVWAHVVSMEGVNYELTPWVRMSVPESARGLTLDLAPRGERAFFSWLLFLGLLPFDRHALTITEVDPGRRFLEDSTSVLQRSWRHERMIRPAARGCIVDDRVTFVPRVALFGPATRLFVEGIFRHRHRRLGARFGLAPP